MAPTLGAARTTLDQDDWKDRVCQWAIGARAVVVSATPAQINGGFVWELYTLANDVEHGRIILVFGTGKKAMLHQRFGAFLGTVSTYPLFQDLSSGWISDGALTPGACPGGWLGYLVWLGRGAPGLTRPPSARPWPMWMKRGPDRPRS